VTQRRRQEAQQASAGRTCNETVLGEVDQQKGCTSVYPPTSSNNVLASWTSAALKPNARATVTGRASARTGHGSPQGS
jgi:hypothetical protein